MLLWDAKIKLLLESGKTKPRADSSFFTRSLVSVSYTHLDVYKRQRLVNLDEAVTTMYPLMEPALNDLASQICTKQSLEDITYSDDNKYTSQVLLDAITSCLLYTSYPSHMPCFPKHSGTPEFFSSSPATGTPSDTAGAPRFLQYSRQQMQ